MAALENIIRHTAQFFKEFVKKIAKKQLLFLALFHKIANSLISHKQNIKEQN